MVIQTVVSTLLVLITAEFLPKAIVQINPNKFLNIGLKYCTNDWVLIINNDLVFTPEWLDNIMVEYHSDPNIKSFSPFEPDWFNKYYYGLFNEGNVYTGYTTGVELLGWCILVKKEVLDLINGFDEQFVFYYQDNDYSEILIKNGVKHGLVRDSIATHLESQTVKDKFDSTTVDNLRVKNYFYNKWGKEI